MCGHNLATEQTWLCMQARPLPGGSIRKRIDYGTSDLRKDMELFFRGCGIAKEEL